MINAALEHGTLEPPRNHDPPPLPTVSQTVIQQSVIQNPVVLIPIREVTQGPVVETTPAFPALTAFAPPETDRDETTAVYLY
jgi:hypothetical protein